MSLFGSGDSATMTTATAVPGWARVLRLEIRGVFERRFAPRRMAEDYVGFYQQLSDR